MHKLTLALLPAVVACSGEPTYVLVTVTRGDVPTTTPIRSVQVGIEIDGRRDQTPILYPGQGTELVMPTSLSLEVNTGAGRTIVDAGAFGDDSTLLATGSSELVLVRDETSELVVELGKHTVTPSDAGVDAPAPTILLDSASASFGTRTVGEMVTHVFTVTNSGGASAPLSITLDGGAVSAYAITANNCQIALPANGSCTFGATFEPTSVSSFATTVRVLPYEAAAGLVGEAVLFSLMPSSLLLDSTMMGTSSPSKVVMVKNESSTMATQAISFALIGADATEFVIESGSSCTAGQSLAPGESCTLSVHFAPTSAGSKTASLSVTDRRTMSIPLTGTGTN